MAYVSAAEIKSYLGIDSTADDALLSTLAEAATAYIESYTHKHFVGATETHYFGPENVDGDVLLLDGWLLSVTSIVDGNGVALTSADYVLLPLNAGRYGVVKRVNAQWVVYEDAPISVSGLWGWSATPPEDVKHACLRLTAYMYRQKDAQVFDTIAVPDAGIINIPQGIPADVKLILDRYKPLVT